MIKFFSDINYSGVLDLTRLNKNLLVSEWYCFFDTIAKVFANCTQKNFNILTSLVQNIGYAIVYNQRIDIGKILWGIIVYRIKCAKRSFDKRTQIHYLLSSLFNAYLQSSRFV